MILRKKSLKLSKKQSAGQNKRKARRRLRRLVIVLIPFVILLIIAVGFLLFQLFHILNTPNYVSPLIVPFTTESEEDRQLARLENALRQKDISYLDLSRTEDSYYTITLSESSVVYISGDEDLNREIASLQYILSRLTMEGKEFKRLDLRFDKPVIVLN